MIKRAYLFSRLRFNLVFQLLLVLFFPSSKTILIIKQHTPHVHICQDGMDFELFAKNEIIEESKIEMTRTREPFH